MKIKKKGGIIQFLCDVIISNYILRYKSQLNLNIILV